MSFRDYGTARQGFGIGDKFDGKKTREAIEERLGVFTKNPQLSTELVHWGQSLLGLDVFDDIDKTKWKFVSL